MRIALKLLLLALVAGAALAVASPAVAQIEVSEEANGAPCPEVTQNDDHVIAGGCQVHVDAEDPMVFRTHSPAFGEVTFAICDAEYDLRLQASGHGLADGISLAGGSCNLEPCDEADHTNYAWIFSMSDFGAPPLGGELTLCVRPSGSAEGNDPFECLIGQTGIDDNDHNYEFRSNGARCSNQLTLTTITMHMVFEDPEVEITR